MKTKENLTASPRKHFDFSRRQLLRGSAAALLPALLTGADSRVRAFVGSYSSPQGPEGSQGHGAGIYVFDVDPATGILSRQQLCEDGMNPSWLALHPSGKYLYAANEISTFAAGDAGAVSAYTLDAASEKLTRLNTVSSQGAGPAHLSVHPSGKFVFVANYYGGSFAVLPIQSDGQLGSATDVKHDQGPVGSAHALSAPPGSFAISGHDRPHAHMIESDPSGKFVIGTDLGTDTIHIWRFNTEARRLDPTANVSVPAGDGPRHFVFHPNGKWLYSLQEEASTLMLFDFDQGAGALKLRQQVSSLPAAFTGTNFTSEVRVSHDGRFVYAANRLHDSIAWFSIGNEGQLKFAGETWTRGDYPRSFTIDPNGNFLYSCNQRADSITSFRVDRASGALTFTGRYTAIGTPAIIIFLAA